MNKHIITDQKAFFNKIAAKEVQLVVKNKQFYDYVNKEQVDGFEWLSDCKTILDYGCGTGTSIDLFIQHHKLDDYQFYGVDIAEQAIEIAKLKYPDAKLFVIDNNKISQIENDFLDGAYMLHVLHHSHNHQEIFTEICKKLKPGGKFLINDLTSRNLLIRWGRSLFGYMPSFIKNRFSDDLLVDGKIPEKYVINVEKIVKQLENSGFLIEKIDSGHLFFFLFNWVDRFVPFSRTKLVSDIYLKISQFESWLLSFAFFKKYAEIVCIKCIKKDPKNINNNLISGNYSMSFNKNVYDQVSTKATCLDVGCWNGNLGKHLIEKKNCIVDGLDFREDVLEQAKQVGYRNTFCLNLNGNKIDFTLLGNNKYDYIIFADVLEHLINPENVLQQLKKYLNKDGAIIVSLPNDAFLLNRILLLFGKWNYKEFGTLDKTHLKFFTLDSAINFIQNTGFEIKKVKPYNQFGILEKLRPIEKYFPRLFAYQFLIKARLENES